MRQSLPKPWLICSIATAFFFYSFIQMTLLNALSLEIMHTFSINAAELGRLSIWYSLATILFLFPAGMLADRYPLKILLTTACLISTAGLFLFANTHSLFTAEVARFISGIGGSIAFIGAIRLASQWLPKNKLELATGIIVAIGMLGCIFSNTTDLSKRANALAGSADKPLPLWHHHCSNGFFLYS